MKFEDTEQQQQKRSFLRKSQFYIDTIKQYVARAAKGLVSSVTTISTLKQNNISLLKLLGHHQGNLRFWPIVQLE